ncbi:MAG TPA: aminodeoxychorismate synthase component I [Bacteroidia bacterium]|nr:aminodeoxychorismate synthase component I [Bacteroidia bacterium]
MLELLDTYSEQKIPFLFYIDFDKTNPIVIPLNEVNKQKILFDFKGYTNFEYPKNPESVDFSFEKHPISYRQYKNKFDQIQYYLRQGDSYLVNLTCITKIDTSLSLEDVFTYSKAPYKLLVRNEFVVFSPEPFVEIKDGIISSFPMKGTINAAIPDAEKVILENEKELAEHSTMVDLIRNDLSIVATQVELKRFRYISRIKTFNSELLQVSSEISGIVKKELLNKMGTLLSSLLPAGSISGAPKRKTVEIIKEVEGYDRGYYTGIFGYFDGKNLQSVVMIRFIEKINGQLYFKSGGGITVYSDAESEYQELIDKVYVPINRIN